MCKDFVIRGVKMKTYNTINFLCIRIFCCYRIMILESEIEKTKTKKTHRPHINHTFKTNQKEVKKNNFLIHCCVQSCKNQYVFGNQFSYFFSISFFVRSLGAPNKLWNSKKRHAAKIEKWWDDGAMWRNYRLLKAIRRVFLVFLSFFLWYAVLCFAYLLLFSDRHKHNIGTNYFSVICIFFASSFSQLCFSLFEMFV